MPGFYPLVSSARKYRMDLCIHQLLTGNLFPRSLGRCTWTANADRFWRCNKSLLTRTRTKIVICRFIACVCWGGGGGGKGGRASYLLHTWTGNCTDFPCILLTSSVTCMKASCRLNTFLPGFSPLCFFSRHFWLLVMVCRSNFIDLGPRD